MANVKVKGSAKLFDNKILNALTRTNPLIILGMYIPLCAFLMWYFYNYVQPSTGILVGVFFAVCSVGPFRIHFAPLCLPFCK